MAKKILKIISSIALLALLLAIIGWVTISFFKQDIFPEKSNIADSVKIAKKKLDDSLEFLKAIADTNSSDYHIINVSDSNNINLNYGIDKYAGRQIRRIFSGRRINIAITGVDSRLGSGYKHADANHIISILIDYGLIEITSIPRDTYTDAGFDDTTGQNKLTVFRAIKGRTAYLKEIATIAGLDKIHYYIELGFSQAIGILEWLGYKESGSTLQILRSRTGLGGDDYQRTYNQAQFIRQMILHHFDKFKGFLGDILINGGLSLVESNLTPDKVREIVNLLESKQFPKSQDDITIKIRPPVNINYRVYDFADINVINQLKKRIENYNEKHFFTDSLNEKTTVNVLSKLRSALRRAASDTAKRPQQVINKLQTYFDQRAWLQVKDSAQRYELREQFMNLLINAYYKKQKYDRAGQIKQIVEAEKKLFNYKVKTEKPKVHDSNSIITNKH